ncbi:MAG: hypothetical protein Q9M20_03275 [Mariprofundaceae bacterium]|nr:hypothetical protein [Mariprofundaceae bacterium]
MKIVTHAKLSAPTDQAGLLLWFTRILRDVDQSQRFAIEMQHGLLTRAAVIVEFENVGNNFDTQRTFELVRREVVEAYGQPDRFFNQGNFGANLGVDLAANKFIRVMEWKRDGGTLRFGIPRRLDGKVRMELQFGRNFPALKDTLWSLEQVL